MDIRLQTFLAEHADDDLERLLLSASRYPGIDVPWVVTQLAARRHLRHKLPGWLAHPEIIFPSTLSAEQCSSEATACYKQSLVEAGVSVCDLCGGLGVDAYFFAQKAEKVVYMERQAAYCEAARHNFAVLGADNIEVREGDAEALLDGLPEMGLIYVDPARRGLGGRRLFALQDCEPDLLRLLPRLWTHTSKVIAKLSPMADLRQCLALLPATAEVHVLSLRNECKELLFVLQKDAAKSSLPDPPVYAVNLSAESEAIFRFSLEEERALQVEYVPVQAYLYEPNAALLKAGAFKSITRLGVGKLQADSHLYTSAEELPDFPGRRFKVEEIIPFGRSGTKNLKKRLPKANISVRNFPLGADELRRRLGISEGGEEYLFATTLSDGKRALLRCRKTK
ncbi:MAG: class I SAM-dependent methyltransferase [Tannerella sp.]|jgi:hypothetical protein|nr:class I SAM-dependent methyltransferase [Tannerella sp.]